MLLQLARGLRRAIMAPARRGEHVAELRAHAGSAANITRNRGDLVEADLEEVERLDVLRQAVDDGLAFNLERSEQPIPHDEDPAVIAVEVADVLAVMHAMVRRRVEDPLERADPIDGFG